MGDREVFADVRERLSHGRDEGRSFEEAWPAAVKSSTAYLWQKRRQDLRAVLHATERAWRAAYVGEADPSMAGLVELLRAPPEVGHDPSVYWGEHVRS